MNIRQLETFLWVARLGSVTEACRHLHVTQSTLSMRLKALETELDVQLFDRVHKRLILTPKGRDLLERAEKIMEAVGELRSYLAASDALSGRIRLGIAELIALTWGPELIRQITTNYPRVQLDLTIGVPRPLTDALVDRTLDVSLAPLLSNPADLPFPSFPLGRMNFSWVARPTFELDCDVLTPASLENIRIIGVAREHSIIYWAIQQWFAENNVGIQRYTSCNSLTVSASMVAEGIGVALLPDAYCDPLIRAGSIRRLRASREFYLDFYALCSPMSEQALALKIAELAYSLSTFRAPVVEELPQRLPAKRKRRSA